MVNQDKGKGKAEQFVLRGNAESVIRQLVDEYNSSNGWQVNRIVNNILNFTVVLERNTKQGASKDTAKETPKEKVTKVDVATTDTSETTDVDTVAKSDDETDEAVEPVKTTVKSTRKSANKGQDMYGKLVISLTKNKEGWEL